VKDAEFPRSVPPNAAVYQAKLTSEPDAVKVAVWPGRRLALEGLTVVAEGEGLTVNVPELVEVTLFAVTTILPVVPVPAIAVIRISEFTIKELTGVPPTVTAVAPVKPVPLIVNEPDKAQTTEGVKLVITGADVANE
jgi:hypothetical protein